MNIDVLRFQLFLFPAIDKNSAPQAYRHQEKNHKMRPALFYIYFYMLVASLAYARYGGMKKGYCAMARLRRKICGKNQQKSLFATLAANFCVRH